MRVLQINKYFFHRGGAEAVFLSTIDSLRARGHEVSEFSMRKKENLPSEYSAYFASELPEFSEKQDLFASTKIFLRLFKAKDIENKLNALISAVDPEVAHLHNAYHHLSASTFRTLYKRRVPIVMTVHDVQPMCPNHRMIRGTDDTLCERCHKHKYYHCFFNRCVRYSRSMSFAASVEAYYYYLKNIWEMADLFICPSHFMMDKMVEWGFSRKKMRLLRNSYSVPELYPPLGDKIVYIGRMHVEKGIKILMSALPHLRQYPTVIAGNGPEANWVDTTIRQCSLSNVETRGWVSGEALRKLMAEARVIVVPSLFYENCSMTILESMSNGRLVVASDRGGNPELIVNGETGFLVKPENFESLVEGIREAMGLSDIEAQVISKRAREYVEQNHSTEEYIKKLEEIYNEVRR
ncbi:glycosyltransferase family 4 protein [Patescibacteria group bacterium]|nr:glycosyltransferase family 4 protein [Patescibacteria group bacterium]